MIYSMYCALTNSPAISLVLNQLVSIFITTEFEDRKQVGIFKKIILLKTS